VTKIQEEDMRRVIMAGTAAVAVVLALTACRAADAPAGEEDNGDGVRFDAGVTAEPCPSAVNEDNGCIYLGTLTDLTGPFAGFGGPLGTAQEAFWQRVNEQGGIVAGDQAFDVDVVTYRRDTGYDTAEHSRLYEEIKGNVLALAQSLGTPTTLAILDDLRDSDIVTVPAGYTSLFNFDDIMLESMANYCVESMNAFDYAVEMYDPETVMAVYFPSDFGGDAAGGIQLAAEEYGIEFINVQTPPGAEQQSEAVGQILTAQPDVVFVATGPTELAAIVGGAASQGFTGRFIGSNVTWNRALLDSPAGPALQALYEIASPLEPWATDTPGHRAMRDAIGEPANLNDGYTAGWIWQYPLLAALEAAAANGDLTRAGVREAAGSLSTVDYEGMLPAGAGNYAGGPGAQLLQSTIGVPDPDQPTGTVTVRDWYVGPTAGAWTPEVCFERMIG
jgi:ABC-type branched-subunit amino acid transport system substrate-binding protein